MAFNLGGISEDSEMADINVTPLVDVVLVLLCVFMVTAPLLTTALDIELPEVTTAQPAEASALVIELDSQGAIAVEGRIVSLPAAVELAVRHVGREGASAAVYLRAVAE